MMNFVIFNGGYFGRGTAKSVQVLYISPPVMSVQRYNKEQVWARDGYVYDLEGAYDGYDGEIKIYTDNDEDRDTVIRTFNTREINQKIYANNTAFYQIATVASHVIEEVGSKAWVHHINMSYQPFWFDKEEQIHTDNHTQYSYYGTAPIRPTFRINGGSDVKIQAGHQYMRVNATGGVIVNGESMEVTDLSGNPKARSILEGSFPILEPKSGMLLHVLGATTFSMHIRPAYLLKEWTYK